MQSDKFFGLLRYAIGTTDDFQPLTEEEWAEAYDTCKKQSLQGIAFMGVSRLPVELQPPKQIKLRWFSLTEKIAKRNAKVEEVAVALSEQLAKAGIPSCVLKGLGNAMMYPQPRMRTPGDIDIWLQAEPKRVIRVAKKHNKSAKAEYHHIDFLPIDGVPIEMHYRPSFMNSMINNHRLLRWFNETAPEQMNNRVELSDGVGQVSVPTAAFNRVYQMAHISNHVIHEGIGLRQLLDYYYLLLQGFNDEEKLHDEELLKKFGLYRIASAVMYVLQEVFGLKPEQMIVPADAEQGKFLLDEIMMAGNFGQYDSRVKHNGGQLQKNINRLKRDVRLVWHFPSECLWEPVFRLWHFFWRLKNK